MKTTRIFMKIEARSLPASRCLRVIVWSGDERIAGSADRADVSGLAGVVAELVAEATHQDVDRAVE
jgi:hypothetical protein